MWRILGSVVIIRLYDVAGANGLATSVIIIITCVWRADGGVGIVVIIVVISDVAGA